MKIYMQCPKFKTDIPDELIKIHSALLAGQKSRRYLSPKQAREMQKKGVANRAEKKAKCNP